MVSIEQMLSLAVTPRVHMCDDALCICQSLSELHQSACSACQQFV